MPQIGAITTPASAASATPSANTAERSRDRLMPSARTISLSCAPALTTAPYGVFSRKNQSRPIIRQAKPAAKKR